MKPYFHDGDTNGIVGLSLVLLSASVVLFQRHQDFHGRIGNLEHKLKYTQCLKKPDVTVKLKALDKLICFVTNTIQKPLYSVHV